MNFDIDYIAHNNKLSQMDTYLKILIAIPIMLIALIADNLLLDFVVFIVMAIGITIVAKISVKHYIKFISIPFIFAFVSCIFLIFFFGKGEVIFETGIFGIVVRDDALNLGVYTLTTPISDLLHFLHRLYVPKILIEIALLMYTTIFIFLDQLDVMRNAQETRLGYIGTKSTYRSLGFLFSNLFIRSLEKSETLQNSLNSRGYDGELPIYEPSKK